MIMGNGEINFSPSIRKSIIEEMEQWWGGIEKFLSDVDIITIRIFLLSIILMLKILCFYFRERKY